MINVSLVGGTRLLICHFLDIQSNSFKKSEILNHVQVGNVKVWKRVVDGIFESLELAKVSGWKALVKVRLRLFFFTFSG